jgi:uncharacterized RDD family membrane protein YckC
MEQILDQVDSKTELIYGGFWERFVAALIDGIVLTIAQNIVSYGIYQESTFSGSLNYGVMGFGMIIGLVYNVYFLSSDKQATLGKQAMGLKVITVEGERLTPMNAAGRFFSTYLSAIILLIGYIMVAFDDKKQALHDRLAHTYVIRTR